MGVSKLKTVRWVAVFLAVSNVGVICLGGFLMFVVLQGCSKGKILPVAVVSGLACVRIMTMIGTGIAQEATAKTILSQQAESSVVDAVIRHERRMRYKRWLWWTRFGMVITFLQFVGATYLIAMTVKYVAYDGKSSGCFLGHWRSDKQWKQISMVVFIIIVWLLVMIQCLTGSDVLRWRSFYATHDRAWKAHYEEVFDHGIREVLCCLGRVKYLSILEEDEVYSVAGLLGDLVAYRASGTGHLELLAGLALLQRHTGSTSSCKVLMEAPEVQIQEAANLHPFAEAAYTGPLLDVGRNPVLFPCAWLYRQGILTPWSRNRRPVLEGDNWWRGHAAAFLRYVNLSPEALRRGRVRQAKREAAYFVVVLHHLRSIVIAVRGTETPEDLITDGLCRECSLSMEDLDGLINSDNLAPEVKQRVFSTFPHYGHSGIVEAARELYMQIDGQHKDKYQHLGTTDDFPSETTGFLSSLLGAGCECEGYNVRIVGHSLGGAIATLLGIRLYRRYPNLHVYSYGPLPCVDSSVAEACSSFVTSIVHNDEFSSRLSVSSILRLRAAAITALSQDSSANSAMICKLARQILRVNKFNESGGNGRISHPIQSETGTPNSSSHVYRRRPYKHAIEGGVFLCVHAVSCVLNMPSHHPCYVIRDVDCKLSSNITVDPVAVSDEKRSVLTAGVGEPGQLHQPEETPFVNDLNTEISIDSCDEFNNTDITITYPVSKDTSDKTNQFDMLDACIQSYEMTPDVISCGDAVSQLVGVPSVGGSNGTPPELFLPGLIIHLVPEPRRNDLPLWRSWKIQFRNCNYRAYVVDRESFKDIIISPYMFLDHLPWRCHYAMQRVLEDRKAKAQPDADLLNTSHIV